MNELSRAQQAYDDMEPEDDDLEPEDDFDEPDYPDPDEQSAFERSP